MVREYYFNDHGAQIDRFANSLIAAAKGEPTPEDGYAGSYIGDIAAKILQQAPDALSQPDAEQHETFRRIGVDLMFTHIKESLHEFGTDFDVYTHEESMHTSGRVDQAIARLRENGNIYEKDGATWLRTSAFGDDKDRVVIKSDGKHAYIAGDLAYYLDKRERGFDLCIYMLGADHHGYVNRCAPGRIRTCGLLLRRQTLYPLSYGGAREKCCANGPRQTNASQRPAEHRNGFGARGPQPIGWPA